MGANDETDMVKSVELFMKPYYQNVHIVARLNEILLQHFNEEIFKQQKTKFKPSILAFS